MANKENLSPHSHAARHTLSNNSTPPTIASANRPWQRANNDSPSPGLLTPSSKPALRQQRDHSGCRVQNSPLKVRKTRENLKQASLYADVPPPCVFGFHGNDSECHGEGIAPSRPYPYVGHGQDDQPDTSGTTLVEDASQYPVPRPLTPMGPSHPGALARHRSISRRVLSRVKEGISQRSRSSHSARNAEPDGSLMRRFSGKRKQRPEDQSKAHSFEISRDSIESQVDPHFPDVDTSSTRRSFTDTTISTDELTGTGFLYSRPQSRCVTPAHTRQYSGRMLFPMSASHSPSAEPTPRATAKDIAFSCWRQTEPVQVTVPYIDLSITAERNSVDVGRKRDIWVAVESTVRTRVVESNSMRRSKEELLRKSPMDAIVLVEQKALSNATKSAHKFIVELCSRLNVAGDRLAVLCYKMEQVGSDTTCNCDELHALRPPSLTRLFERLSIAPSTIDTIFEEEWESLPSVLQGLSDKGIRRDLANVFIISTTPHVVAGLVDHLVQWPTHTFKIGLQTGELPSPQPLSNHKWSCEIREDEDDILDVLANMFRDLRHGCNLGSIPSLRLCYKPLQGSTVIEVLGHKAVKDLRLGQRCSLFLKIRVPRIDTSRASLPKDDIDQDSLFAELESIVGTLESEYLHVEARYRNAVLPGASVGTVRQICRMRRPKTDSRWSVTSLEMDEALATRVHGRLACFLAANYPPSRALRMIDRWAVQRSVTPSDMIQNIQRFLQHQAKETSELDTTTTTMTSEGPLVTITTTEVDIPDTHSVEDYSTAPCTPTTDAPARNSPTSNLAVRHHDKTKPTPQTSHLSISTIPPTRTISAPRTTTAVTHSSALTLGYPDVEDTARQLWRQIRRSSLSAKQLSEITSENLQLLESGDGMFKAVRQQALLNKRSIGAETLRDLKWENLRGSGHGEAPWL